MQTYAHFLDIITIKKMSAIFFCVSAKTHLRVWRDLGMMRKWANFTYLMIKSALQMIFKISLDNHSIYTLVLDGTFDTSDQIYQFRLGIWTRSALHNGFNSVSLNSANSQQMSSHCTKHSHILKMSVSERYLSKEDSRLRQFVATMVTAGMKNSL